MRTFFRLLLWLSVTMLSLQGGTAFAIGQAMTKAHGSMSADCHQHRQAAGHRDEQRYQQSGSKAAQPHAKCAAGASCCVVGGAPPPAHTPGFHALALSSSPPAEPDAAMTSFVPATLERPPQGLYV